MSSLLTDALQPHQVAWSQRRAAVIAGAAYLGLNVLALIANFVVPGNLVVSGDGSATMDNIAKSGLLFRGGIAAFVIVLVADVVVAWGLYLFFQRTSRELVLFAAWCRVVYVAITGAALLNLLAAARVADGAGYVAVLGRDQRGAQTMLSLDAYSYGFRIGLVFFGVHLLLIGVAMVRSSYAPTPLGVLVALAGIGYVTTMFASILLSTFDHDKAVFLAVLAIVAVPAEFGLAGWLVWRGGRETTP